RFRAGSLSRKAATGANNRRRSVPRLVHLLPARRRRIPRHEGICRVGRCRSGTCSAVFDMATKVDIAFAARHWWRVCLAAAAVLGGCEFSPASPQMDADTTGPADLAAGGGGDAAPPRDAAVAPDASMPSIPPPPGGPWTLAFHDE